MRNNRFYFLLWCAVLALGIGLRVPDLRHRPMHTDEAVHAVKFGNLLETGTYKYDASEYHGPTLNVFTLIPAWIQGQAKLADLDESTLRLIPVFFGIGLILVLALFIPLIGRSAALASALWVAVSPVQVYYSRYYIQEVLFVFFCIVLLVAVLRYRNSEGWGWAMAAGCALGFMHATKETDVLVLAAAMVAGFALWLDSRLRAQETCRSSGRLSLLHLLIFFLAAVLVSGFFFSSFFAHPRGLLDSFRTYQTYLHRGAGQTLHIQPWFYYFRLLFFFHAPGKPVWSEVLILPFALLAAFQAFRRPNRMENVEISKVKRFLVFYTILLSIVYATIPYKTPWNALGFHYGLLLLAGCGSVDTFRLLVKKAKAVAVLTVVCLLVLIRQAVLLNTTYDSDPCNPWVYAHPSPDVVWVSEVVEAAARAGPDGLRTHVEVVVSRHEYWPLPWILRRLENVGWYDKIDDQAPSATIILVTPEEEPALLRKIYQQPAPGQKHLYLPLWDGYAELRPGVEIRGYVRKDLWDMIPPGTEPLQVKTK